MYSSWSPLFQTRRPHVTDATPIADRVETSHLPWVDRQTRGRRRTLQLGRWADSERFIGLSMSRHPARSRHTSIPGKSLESGLSNDRSRVASFANASGGIQSGNLSARWIAWKRASLRKGSRAGSVLSWKRPPSRSRKAASSHSRAFALSPH